MAVSHGKPKPHSCYSVPGCLRMAFPSIDPAAILIPQISECPRRRAREGRYMPTTDPLPAGDRMLGGALDDDALPLTVPSRTGRGPSACWSIDLTSSAQIHHHRRRETQSTKLCRLPRRKLKRQPPHPLPIPSQKAGAPPSPLDPGHRSTFSPHRAHLPILIQQRSASWFIVEKRVVVGKRGRETCDGNGSRYLVNPHEHRRRGGVNANWPRGGEVKVTATLFHHVPPFRNACMSSTSSGGEEEGEGEGEGECEERKGKERKG
ncbi:hypothetical protein BJ875DRAFT_443459 [Amylocarpus encephaloides]|uniref:Uncharacterized protein n=1 Tax=Amylocarpus encephaloides TaxID=45428 RepID=A0A9P8C331_9HELO|nr:hypothetical protein BJ875DRAFT_443459 [Amylocarpus encephaloides]